MLHVLFLRTSILGVRGHRSYKKGSFGHFGGHFFNFFKVGGSIKKRLVSYLEELKKVGGSVF